VNCHRHLDAGVSKHVLSGQCRCADAGRELKSSQHDVTDATGDRLRDEVAIHGCGCRVDIALRDDGMRARHVEPGRPFTIDVISRHADMSQWMIEAAGGELRRPVFGSHEDRCETAIAA
jgi:hypothetical protein